MVPQRSGPRQASPESRQTARQLQYFFLFITQSLSLSWHSPGPPQLSLGFSWDCLQGEKAAPKKHVEALVKVREGSRCSSRISSFEASPVAQKQRAREGSPRRAWLLPENLSFRLFAHPRMRLHPELARRCHDAWHAQAGRSVGGSRLKLAQLTLACVRNQFAIAVPCCVCLCYGGKTPLRTPTRVGPVTPPVQCVKRILNCCCLVGTDIQATLSDLISHSSLIWLLTRSVCHLCLWVYIQNARVPDTHTHPSTSWQHALPHAQVTTSLTSRGSISAQE